MVQFCRSYNVPYEICGKTVIATTEEEVPRLHALLERGKDNGLTDLRLLNAKQIHEYEPNAVGRAGLRVPQEGIVDYTEVCEAMVKRILASGGEVKFSSEVTSLHEGHQWTIETPARDYKVDFFINCTGLHCDRVSRMAGVHDPTQIVPFRGEYYKLKPERQNLIIDLIYPVPDPRLPFLGVHFTRLIHGGVQAGPNAVLALAREGYRKTDFSLKDTLETITYRGFWKFFLRYPEICWAELRRSCSKQLFCCSLQRLVPDIQLSDLAEGAAGVRAQALTTSGELVHDFYFVRQTTSLHVLNAPSPAATAALAIADEIIETVKDAIGARPVLPTSARSL
jgi:L-2-hydroxyglutarate oxidase LhgO